MIKYPVKLNPVSKEIIWGGDKLKRMYNKKADFDKLAESWELTVRHDGMNTIANGSYEGLSLEEYILSDKIGILGTSCKNADRFPLLIKFIDARDNLSIQVHPDNEYSLKNENEYGKTEMWYIMEADKGAQLVYGLKDDCTLSEFAKAVEEDEIESKLNYVNVKKGDVYFIPSGQVHAIGKGILIAEIQQNSNVTYRVYDYKRRQADGSLRPLHTAKALDVIKLRTPEEIRSLQFEGASDDPALLCSCAYFRVWKYEIEESMPLIVDETSFMSVLVLDAADGAAILDGVTEYPIAKGDSWFLPAGLGEITIRGKAEVILSSIKK